MELKQRRLTDSRHFRLEDDGLWFRIRTPMIRFETKYKYDDLGLGTEILLKKEVSWIFIFGALVSLFAIYVTWDHYNPERMFFYYVLAVFFVVFFVFSLLAIIDSRKEVIRISDGMKKISLLRNSPNRQEVDHFVEALQRKIKVKTMELHVRPNDPYIDMEFKLSQLQYLLDTGTINLEMYNAMEDTLRNKNKRSIGFRGNKETTEE